MAVAGLWCEALSSTPRIDHLPAPRQQLLTRATSASRRERRHDFRSRPIDQQILRSFAIRSRIFPIERLLVRGRSITEHHDPATSEERGTNPTADGSSASAGHDKQLRGLRKACCGAASFIALFCQLHRRGTRSFASIRQLGGYEHSPTWRRVPETTAQIREALTSPIGRWGSRHARSPALNGGGGARAARACARSSRGSGVGARPWTRPRRSPPRRTRRAPPRWGASRVHQRPGR